MYKQPYFLRFTQYQEKLVGDRYYGCAISKFISNPLERKLHNHNEKNFIKFIKLFKNMLDFWVINEILATFNIAARRSNKIDSLTMLNFPIIALNYVNNLSFSDRGNKSKQNNPKKNKNIRRENYDY